MTSSVVSSNDTIVALSSAPGRAAVGVVRISGAGARRILERVLKRVACVETPRMLRRDFVIDASRVVVGEVLSVYLPGPATFTGQDMAEIHCHGGPTITNLVLETLLNAGARAAQPGEFSRRAFENGKLDLPRAEAILHLIDAQNREQALAAARSLAGELSKELEFLAQKTKEILALLEADLDFPEEETGNKAPWRELEDLQVHLSKLALRHRPDENDSFEIVLCGQQNVGKSSIVNSLAEKQIALVTHIAGTTRDPVKARVRLNDQVVEIVDTAGLTTEEPGDIIDRLCQQRTRQIIQQAALVVWVCDVDRPSTGTHWCKEPLLVVNKIDLADEERRKDIERWKEKTRAIIVSAKTGEGLEELKREIEQRLIRLLGPPEGIPLSLRQKHIFERITKALETAKARVHEQQNELAAEELRQVLRATGELKGEFIDTDVLDIVFSRFCIGK